LGMGIDELYKELGSKIKRGTDFRDSDYKAISTGSIKLDWALKLPFLEGSMIEVFAPNGVGKTTLALSVCRNAMKMGKHVFYIDLEFKLREAQIKMFQNFNRDLFDIIYPDTAEDCMNIMLETVKKCPGCVIVLDSIGGLLPEVEDAESFDKQGMATISRMLHKLVRKITSYAARNKVVLIFLNHLTATMEMYGQKNTTHGGNAVKNRAAQRIELAALSAGAIKDGDVKIGQYVRATVVKNNVHRPFISVEFPIIYGRGIDEELDIVEFAIDVGILTKSGAWIYLPLEEGEEKPKAFQKGELLEKLKSDLEFRKLILDKIAAVT
jgi:recombination protein RecA